MKRPQPRCVRSIEHGTYLSDQPLALMKERGTYFVPPISFLQEMIVRDGFRCVRLNLWDEERKKLVPLPKP